MNFTSRIFSSKTQSCVSIIMAFIYYDFHAEFIDTYLSGFLSLLFQMFESAVQQINLYLADKY